MHLQKIVQFFIIKSVLIVTNDMFFNLCLTYCKTRYQEASIPNRADNPVRLTIEVEKHDTIL